MLAQIVAQTDGIPLFVEEVTKAVVEAGLSTAGPAQDAAIGPLPALAIPATLHEALMARLDRLGSAKSVAQLGATIGREFAYTLLRAVAPLEDEALQRDLATLVAAELLYQRGQPPRAIYRFKHALVQEAAYESVLRSVRRQTHQRILQVLEAQFPETAATAPALLAHHALRGEVWNQAMTYCRQAGEQALARSAYREAVAAFEQALEAVQHLPESRDTLVQAIDLRLALRTALWPLGEIGQIFINLQHAAALAEALGDPHRLGRVTCLSGRPFSVCMRTGPRPCVWPARPGNCYGPGGCWPHGHGAVLPGNRLPRPGRLSPGGGVLSKERGVSPHELLQEHFGLPGLASVVSRSHLVCVPCRVRRLRRGKSACRGRDTDRRGCRPPL